MILRFSFYSVYEYLPKIAYLSEEYLKALIMINTYHLIACADI